MRGTKPRTTSARPAESSSSTDSSSSSDCETLSDSSSVTDAPASHASNPQRGRPHRAPGIGQTGHLRFEGALSMLPCCLAPALTGHFASKDACRSCLAYKRTATVHHVVRAHRLLDELDLSFDRLPLPASDVVTALCRQFRDAARPKQRQAQSTDGDHDWISLLATLQALDVSSLLECWGELLHNRLAPLIAGAGPDSHEPWFLSTTVACVERLQCRLHRLVVPARQSQSEQAARRKGQSGGEDGLPMYIQSDAYKKSLASKQAKALTQCLKLAASRWARASALEQRGADSARGGLDLELSCLERALLVSTSPTVLVDVSGGPCRGSTAWQTFRSRASRYLCGDRSHNDHGCALARGLSKLMHLVVLGRRGDIDHFLDQIGKLTPGIEALCLVDTFWLHHDVEGPCPPPEQTFSSRWTLPPSIVRLAVLRECVALELITDDRHRDVANLFSVPGSRPVARSLLRHPDIHASDRERSYPLRQRSLQAKLHERLRLESAVTIGRQSRLAGKSARTATEAEGENVKAWSEMVSLYGDVHCRWPADEADEDARPPLDRLTTMCLRSICSSAFDAAFEAPTMAVVPQQFRWVIDNAYRCVSCGQIILPPIMQLQGHPAMADEPGDAIGQDPLTSLRRDPALAFSSEGLGRILGKGWLLDVDLGAEERPRVGHRNDRATMTPPTVASARYVQQLWAGIMKAGFLPSIKEEIVLVHADDERDANEHDEGERQLRPGLASERVVFRALIGASSASTRTWSCKTGVDFPSDNDDGGVDGSGEDSVASADAAYPASEDPRSSSVQWRFCLPCFRSHVSLPKSNGSGAASEEHGCRCIVCRAEREPAATGRAVWLRPRRATQRLSPS
ncbi:uncharacterized protein PFL1_00479 [Pseudozyma flocculosa PF-1]|uniref:Uncharacterized protein n=1 Tax=Pseudozyma flocculosa TaxID=84751 RepID=A0A5C3ERN2_9BASI|nr:uncharacterized protein PFL1_00479 [Pseudozyma flocculosa PF-1]EPQ32282.1 hypothetical protein PFL1_00479 [Pseudozyma flocculosa PF-1]SPO34762.1 uncharacterized protein PSFLO_00233 [Pseudozyma flocculosa]